MNEKEKIERFIQDYKDIPKKIIVIYWPTACWKTGLSIQLAKYLNTEVISTDSRQIFKELDIGTGKIKESEKEGVPHHMIDIISPNEKFSVWAYKKMVLPLLEGIWAKWKIPLLVWGTGLYIDSLIYDFQIPKIPPNEDLRSELEKEAEIYGKEYVYKKLVNIDPLFAQTLHPNNLRYVIRALEVKLMTWKSKWDTKEEKVLSFPTLFITPYEDDREKLYSNINKRVIQMFDEWLVWEVQHLLQKGYTKDDFWLKTIGYSEVIEYLEWNISLEESIASVQQNSRNYAKRQLTWFRKYIQTS